VVKSHSRPYTSNDNPFLESNFKTVKYAPTFPGSFGSMEDANAFCRQFFNRYNSEHHHGGIGYFTPEQVHYGKATQIQQVCMAALNFAYGTHPERFVKGVSQPPALPEAVWINPPALAARVDANDPPEPSKAKAEELALPKMP